MMLCLSEVGASLARRSPVGTFTVGENAGLASAPVSVAADFRQRCERFW